MDGVKTAPAAGPVKARVTDGRRLRAEASRRRIVAATMDLIREGHPDPGAEQVAARAGVGLRTVFRLFSDMEGLHREMSAIMRARLMPIAAEPIGATDWRRALLRLLVRRARLFEEMMPFKVAADLHRLRSRFLAAQHTDLVRLQRAMLVRVLPEEVQRRAGLIEALDLVMSLEAWRRLRIDQGLSPARAASVIRRLIRALVGAA